MSSLQRRTSSKGIDSWRVSFWVDGKQHWQGGFSTGQSAADFKALLDRVGHEAALAVLRAQAGGSTSPTLAEQLDRHLADLAASVEPGTIRDYRSMAERTWLPRLGPVPIDALTRRMVTDWVAWQRQQETAKSRTRREHAIARRAAEKDKAKAAAIVIPEPELYKSKSIANAHGLLSALLQAAVDDELLERNVARKVKLPAGTDRKLPVFLTPPEFQAIADQVQDHYRLFVTFIAGTGARWSEATALTVGQLDLEAGMVTLSRAWKRAGETTPRRVAGTKTIMSLRQITLGNMLTTALTEHVKGRGQDELVFTSVQGRPIQAQHFRERVWLKALAASGVTKPATPHSLRHSHGSWLIALGVPLFEVSRRLGHESITTTADVYGHLDPGAILRTAGATDTALAGVRGLIAA